jgi:hypothetical protein
MASSLILFCNFISERLYTLERGTAMSAMCCTQPGGALTCSTLVRKCGYASLLLVVLDKRPKNNKTCSAILNLNFYYYFFLNPIIISLVSDKPWSARYAMSVINACPFSGFSPKRGVCDTLLDSTLTRVPIISSKMSILPIASFQRHQTSLC